MQTGDGNEMTISQIGNRNFTHVEQSDNNTAVIDIAGNRNGGGTLAGDAGVLASAHGLNSGDVIQKGLGSNDAHLTISSSNDNQFAFLQDGSGNNIVGTVSGGGSNSATVVQVGASNMTNFNQSGAGNMVTATQ